MMSHIINLWSSPNETASKKNFLCCGCNACATICPKEAITMNYDDEGFLYPFVDENVCINCGLCTKVCPVLNKCDNQAPYLRTYAGYSSDRETLNRCASGGFATELSRLIIRQGGVVFGVRYTEDYVKTEYHVASTLEELDQFVTSKYVQSEKGNVYKSVLSKLEEDKLVLFIGCPCDVSALKRFVRKDYEKLITCELVCMGVTSYRIAEDYKKWTEKKNGSVLTYINSKSKIRGWFVPHLEERFANGKRKYTSFYSSYYGYAFQIFNRPSCYHCQYRGSVGVGDIRICDFWGVKQSDVFWNSMGVSGILVRTTKGEQYIEELRSSGFNAYETDQRTATINNNHKNKGGKYLQLRQKFADRYKKGASLPSACWHAATIGFALKFLIPDQFHFKLKQVYHFFVDHKR